MELVLHARAWLTALLAVPLLGGGCTSGPSNVTGSPDSAVTAEDAAGHAGRPDGRTDAALRGRLDVQSSVDAHLRRDARARQDASPDTGRDSARAGDSAPPGEAGASTCTSPDGDAGCYAITCTATHQSLQANRDRLIADLATRKCTESCTLWAALNQSERYIFLMNTAYLAATASLLRPPPTTSQETALDHAVALYSINGAKAGQGVIYNGLGGNDYNRIYLGFDALATCVMRNYTEANPTHEQGYNTWVKSDDLAGPHAPFTEREMIAWFKAALDPQTQGPQFHHWAQSSDFTQSGLDMRLGVCGVTDPSITELTIAFDTIHDSDPLGHYGADGMSMGGLGWQIVDQFLGAGFADWSYMPTTCPTTPPVNTSVTGGGTFAGMGPSLGSGTACVPAPLGTCH
jgi:hypothetical protein